MAKPVVYRVEDIAEHTSRDDLNGLFTPSCSAQVKVASLSKAADWNEDNRSLTVTIIFTPTVTHATPQLVDTQLGIDADFHGFTPLYTPEGPIDADIIAVTGLAGHAHGSWAVSADRMWLRDFLPRDLPRCRVLTYGYDSRLDANESHGILYDHVNNFIVKLQDMRYQAQCTNRPVVFIGHSLGCLIIKEALINFQSFTARRREQNLFPVVCLVFIGAPHRGLEVASLQTLVEGRPSAELIRELESGSETLIRQNANFKNLYGDFNILTIYEMKDTPSVRQLDNGTWGREGPPITMVKKDSAILHWEKEKTIGINQDHRHIARINRGQNGCYNQVRGFIRQSLEEVCKTRPPPVDAPVEETFNTRPVPASEQLPIHAPVVTEHLFSKNSTMRDIQLARRFGSRSLTGQEESAENDAFFLAIRNGEIEDTRAILDGGIPVNRPNQHGQTALHVAARSAAPEIVQLLLEGGADVHARDPDGWTPFHIGCRHNSLAALGLLVDAGVAVSNRTLSGTTPLHLATKYFKSLEVVKFLLSVGCEADATDSDGKTALHTAVEWTTSRDLIHILVWSGATVNIRDHKARTSLHLAASRRKTAILEMLVAAGADLEARDCAGWTPLFCATNYGRASNVRWLVGRGANFRAKDVQGRQPVEVDFATFVPERTRKSITAYLRGKLGPI